jgi:N-acetylneuraminic acid mutarotase
MKTKGSVFVPESWFTGLALAMTLLLIAARPAQAQTSNTWSSGAAMPTARQGVATGVINGRVYVVSGATDSGVVAVNEIYNPRKNTWTTGASIPTARFVPASAVVNSILYVIGGCTSACASGTGAMTVVEAYNPATNTWSTKAALPTATDSMYAVAVGSSTAK